MMNSNWRDWLAAIAFFAAFGSAGSDDYDYRCDQARKANKHETCKMIASKEVENDSHAKHRIGTR